MCICDYDRKRSIRDFESVRFRGAGTPQVSKLGTAAVRISYSKSPRAL
jgi:hypothetical protein